MLKLFSAQLINAFIHYLKLSPSLGSRGPCSVFVLASAGLDYVMCSFCTAFADKLSKKASGIVKACISIEKGWASNTFFLKNETATFDQLDLAISLLFLTCNMLQLNCRSKAGFLFPTRTT